MTDIIPTWHTGKTSSVVDLTDVTIDPADGTVTSGTPRHMVNSFDGWNYQGRTQSVEIHPTAAVVENNVPVTKGFVITINQLTRSGGQSDLMDLYMASGKAYVLFSGESDDGTNTRTLTTYAMMADCTYGIVEGKNAAVMTLITAGNLPSWTTEADS